MFDYVLVVYASACFLIALIIPLKVKNPKYELETRYLQLVLLPGWIIVLILWAIIYRMIKGDDADVFLRKAVEDAFNNPMKRKE